MYIFLTAAVCWYCQRLSEKKVQFEAKEKIMKKEREHIFPTILIASYSLVQEKRKIIFF